MLNEHGRYYSNPKLGQRADEAESNDQKGEGQTSKKGGHAEIHKHDAGYKTVTHGEDGSQDEQDHSDFHSAVNHVAGHFGEQQEPDSDEQGGMSDMDEDDMMGEGEVRATDSGAY